MKKSKPFEEILNRLKESEKKYLTSSGKPGPMTPEQTKEMIENASSLEVDTNAIMNDHELLVPILSETNGAILFQEQVMKIATDLANYSNQEAKILSQLIIKNKINSIDNKNKEEFIEGCKKNNIPEDKSSKIFDKMVETFDLKARNQFNLSRPQI